MSEPEPTTASTSLPAAAAAAGDDEERTRKEALRKAGQAYFDEVLRQASKSSTIDPLKERVLAIQTREDAAQRQQQRARGQGSPRAGAARRSKLPATPPAFQALDAFVAGSSAHFLAGGLAAASGIGVVALKVG